LSALYPNTKKITGKELFKILDWCTVQYTQQWQPQCPDKIMYTSQILYQVKLNGNGSQKFMKFQSTPFVREYFFKILRKLRRADTKNKKKLYLYAFSDDLIASIYHLLQIIPTAPQYKQE